MLVVGENINASNKTVGQASYQLECRNMKGERETGFEPATACLEGRYSTRLSYSRTIRFILAPN